MFLMRDLTAVDKKMFELSIIQTQNPLLQIKGKVESLISNHISPFLSKTAIDHVILIHPGNVQAIPDIVDSLKYIVCTIFTQHLVTVFVMVSSSTFYRH